MNNKSIIIETSPWEVMTASAIDAFPEECCGFFWGAEDGTRITLAMAVDNDGVVNRHSSFSIRATDYIAAEHLADQRRLKLLGIYHSHPGQSARPSTKDIQAAFPNLYYIIMGTNTHEVYDVSCWQLDESGHFTANAIQVINPIIKKNNDAYCSNSNTVKEIYR